MPASSLRRFIPLAAIFLIIGYFTYIYDDQVWSLPHFSSSLGGLGATATASAKPVSTGSGRFQPLPSPNTPQQVPSKGDSKASPPKEPSQIQPLPPSKDNNNPQPLPPSNGVSTAPAKPPSVYREVFSVSRRKGNYFEIEFPGFKVFNPNILPHPSKPDTWVVVAQKERGGSHDDFEAIELVCEAVFNDEDDTLTCSTPPQTLPVKPTKGGLCKGELEWFNGVSGPHDARVFYGPKVPYIIYGSRSGYTCFGQWIQDFRGLQQPPKEKDVSNTNIDPIKRSPASVLFSAGTELHRPGPFGEFEKNWFVFWDRHGQMYAHYDLAPRRSFAQLDNDGAVIGEDMSVLAIESDEACMAKYMPKVTSTTKSSLHQATNSLSITLCARADPACKPTEENTFIMAIFQQKFYYAYHNVYRPYVVLLRSSAPFAVHAISQKPMWFHGHKKMADKHAAAEKTKTTTRRRGLEERDAAAAEMFFVTSIAWKTNGQTYHGYIDDVMFVTFGIEDNRAGAIDVRAGDLLKDLGVCGL
ncbi:hypothetical protein A1O1_07949 [Capronia coronata CBS 617.96]|uniref:Uncharacterized protein n=1 Tax=Capronia coronata CBS 617.96 TaxID=1182541 RepID=W9YHY0_9EURO|nr:uncharacterized protein A1O1_07949 [Capronia coronata CBS 617.96]EXJ81884.1 hypothetical protein A1O1_07949 [Capronia coronata CBS 617.96]